MDNENTDISWGRKNEFLLIVFLSLMAGLLAKLPKIGGVEPEQFYSKNISFIVFPFLIIYFVWKQQQAITKLIFPLIVMLILVIYINFLPFSSSVDSIILACIHLPIFLWGLLGHIYMGGDFKNLEKRISFLRYNADFLVMTALILISGALFSALTMGLFSLIELDIRQFYGEYILVFSVSALPIMSTFLVQNNPKLVSKISPVIAKIFTPIVSLMLFFFLLAVIIKGKYPTNNRNALMVFNGLLIGVMALILFSITEVSKVSNRKANTMILLCLSALTIIINCIALVSIVIRINEYGVSPNRIAVMGANILIMMHILLVFKRLFGTARGKSNIQEVENGIASFLPYYIIWAAFVTLLFPVIFGFK